jgi:hypothetical protein
MTYIRRTFLVALVVFISMTHGAKAQSTPFHDDFNRTDIGANYDGPLGTWYAVPFLNGTSYAASDPSKNTYSILRPSAATIGPNQFARETMVNSTVNGVFSLFLRATLAPDKSTIESGYELDYGRLWDESGDWWVVYYIDASGFSVLQMVYPSTNPIPSGSVVEFRVSGTTLQVIINGQVEWTGTHSGVTTGTPGLGVYGDSILDEFYAGDFVPDTPPTSPTIVTVSSGPDGTTANVSWTDVATETGYYVERCSGANCSTGFTVVGNSLPADTIIFNDTGLTLGTTYGYRVRAHNDGGYSSYSSIAYLSTSIATPPALPTGLTATPSSNGRSVTLNWTLAAGSQTRLGISRCSGTGCTVTGLVSQLSPSITAYADDSVEPNTTYRYQIYAANDAGTPVLYSLSDVAQTTTPHLPAAPTALTASIEGGVVVLNWTDNADNETGYTVERCARYGCYGFESLPTTIAANSTGFTDSGTTGGYYSYRLRAVNDVGPSAFAEITSVDTPCGDVILSPNKISMVVGDSRTLDAFNASDALLSGLVWNSIAPNVVTLSTDDPPVLTATAVGTTTVEVSSGSSPSACVATLTIYSGPELPEGTVKWSVPTNGGMPDIIPAVPSSEGVADVFAVSRNGKVQAITADGHTKWTANTNGLVIADFQGGVIDAGDVIQKLDGKTGQPLPAYTLQDSYWVFGIHTDGTVFAVDRDKVVGVDSKTGQPKFSIQLQSGVSTWQNDCPDGGGSGSQVNDGYFNAERIMVAGDGYAYLAYGSYSSSATAHCEEQNDAGGRASHLRTSSYHAQVQYRLLRIGSDGASKDLLIQTWTEDHSETDTGQRIPLYPLPDGEWALGYETHLRNLNTGSIPPSSHWDTDPITNADEGVVLSWVDLNATGSSYTKDCDGWQALQHPCTESSTSQFLSYAPKLTTVTNGQLSTTVPVSVSGVDQEARIQPVLQTENGDYIGVQYSDVQKLIAFNAAGEKRWTKPVPNGAEPLYALANGGVIYREGVYAGMSPQVVTLDADGNEVSRAADTGIKRSWTVNAYRPGSIESVVPNFKKLARTFAGVVSGNYSGTLTSVLLDWFPPLEHCTSSPGCLGPYDVAHNALSDLIRRLDTEPVPGSVAARAQVEIFDKLHVDSNLSPATTAGFVRYIRSKKPLFYDGTESTYCYESLQPVTSKFCNFLPFTGTVKEHFENDSRENAAADTPSYPLLVFFRPTSLGFNDSGKNKGNEALIFHEALHGYTRKTDLQILTDLSIPRDIAHGICSITVRIQNDVLDNLPDLDPQVQDPCPFSD